MQDITLSTLTISTVYAIIRVSMSARWELCRDIEQSCKYFLLLSHFFFFKSLKLTIKGLTLYYLYSHMLVLLCASAHHIGCGHFLGILCKVAPQKTVETDVFIQQRHQNGLEVLSSLNRKDVQVLTRWIQL